MKKEYYWLRLKTDFFTNIAMKKLRRIAGGDTYTIIYLKLMLLSLRNNGTLFFENVEPTFYEEMALALDEDAENVRVTLAFLESARLIEQKADGEYFLTEVPLLIGKESESAERVREHRKRKALHCNTNVTDCNTLVTDCNTEKRREEIEKSIEEKRESIGENRKRFIPPTLEQVTSYCSERKNNVDPQRFIDFYESKGWMVGKNKMKDWQAAVRTWEQRDNEPHKSKAAQELDDFYKMGAEWVAKKKGENA